GGVDHLVAVELHPVGPVGDALPQPQQPGGGDGGHAQQILGLDGKVLKGPVEAVAQRAAGTGQQIRAGQSEAPVVPDLDAAAHRGRVQPGGAAGQGGRVGGEHAATGGLGADHDGEGLGGQVVAV